MHSNEFAVITISFTGLVLLMIRVSISLELKIQEFVTALDNFEQEQCRAQQVGGFVIRLLNDRNPNPKS